MKALLNFLIEANLGLLFFYGIYWLLLRSENQFAFKRIYLIGSLLASLLFPLITITGEGEKIIPSLSSTHAAYWLPEFTVYANVSASTAQTYSSYSVWSWIYGIYTVGSILILLIFIYRVISLITLFRKSIKYSWKNFRIAESDHVPNSFSFFHYIFLGQASQLTETEKLEILNHESIHAEQKHSFDILLINLLGILFWYNPVIYLYKNALVQVHEFEADARSVKDRDMNEYCSLLAKVTLQANGYPLANHFAKSLTLKRIAMMKTVNKKIKGWKVTTISITSLLLFFVVACQDQVMQDIQTITDNSSAATILPAKVEAELLKLKKGNPSAEFIVMEMNEEGKKKMEELEKDPNFNKQVISLSVIKDEEQSFVIIQKGDRTNMLADMTASSDEVFTIVEETAQPVGGYPELYKYIAQTIKYPQEARSKHIEGKVFLEFVVNTDGKLLDIHPIKGIGAGCDEEAVRMLENSPIVWIPAKQRGITVKQRMVIPISFILSADSPPAIAIGEVTAKDQEFIPTVNKVVENGVTYLTGMVKNQNGIALTGTNIVIEGTTTGTVTSKDGTFKLAVTPTASGNLVFSFVGYKTKVVGF